MKIQQLSTESLNKLIELVLEFWPGCIFDEEFEAYKNVLSAENEIIYLVEEKGIYIAFIHLSLRTDYVEGATAFPVAYIEALYVKPDFQRLGIGKLLLDAGENWSKQKGCSQIASDTELNNINAIAFHNKLGFEEANRVICFIKKL